MGKDMTWNYVDYFNMKIYNHLGHSFLPELLPSDGIALDCGANYGNFAEWLSRNTALNIHSFEPDPRLYERLPILPRCQYHKKALSGKSGLMKLSLGNQRCSSLVYKEDTGQLETVVEATTLGDFCADQRIISIALIKMDIEGAELDVLSSMPDSLLQQTAQLTVEFHDFLRIEDRPQIRQIITRLQRLGFFHICFSHFNYGDMLFVNQRLHKLSLLDRGYMLVQKYQEGIKRFISRKAGVS